MVFPEDEALLRQIASDPSSLEMQAIFTIAALCIRGKPFFWLLWAKSMKSSFTSDFEVSNLELAEKIVKHNLGTRVAQVLEYINLLFEREELRNLVAFLAIFNAIAHSNCVIWNAESGAYQFLIS